MYFANINRNLHVALMLPTDKQDSDSYAQSQRDPDIGKCVVEQRILSDYLCIEKHICVGICVCGRA
jgi:hypothetical protein